MADIYSDLLIRIRPQDNTSEAYSVEVQLNDGAAGAAGRFIGLCLV